MNPLDRYSINELGEVTDNTTGKLVGHKNKKTGYVTVPFMGGNIYVHRLMAYKYLGMPLDSDLVVDHLNGIKYDNRLVNLDVVTTKENVTRALGIYSCTREEIEEAVLTTKSWDSAYKILGFASKISLRTYYSRNLGGDIRALSKRAGIKYNKEGANSLRELTLEQIHDLVKELGSRKAVGEMYGIGRQTVSNIIKEKTPA